MSRGMTLNALSSRPGGRLGYSKSHFYAFSCVFIKAKKCTVAEPLFLGKNTAGNLWAGKNSISARFGTLLRECIYKLDVYAAKRGHVWSQLSRLSITLGTDCRKIRRQTDLMPTRSNGHFCCVYFLGPSPQRAGFHSSGAQVKRPFRKVTRIHTRSLTRVWTLFCYNRKMWKGNRNFICAWL